MAEPLQALDHRSWYAILELINTAEVQATGHIYCFLDVTTEINQIGQQMRLTNRLILPTNHPERQHSTPGFGHYAWHDGMKGPFTWRNAIRMIGLNPKTATTILKQHPGAV